MAKHKQLKKAIAANKAQQYAAIPIRFTGQGELQLLLLTSRGSRRWVIPKGWPMRKLTPAAAAAREAYEEAGIEGLIRPRSPVGSYRYAKQPGSINLAVEVIVFLLWVERQHDSWPEQAERETRWFSPEEAATLVAEPELASLLLSTRDLAARERPRSRGSWLAFFRKPA
jgi:8-oxo-dGTP pyrophosphatase MutT (NUDIX family)